MSSRRWLLLDVVAAGGVCAAYVAFAGFDGSDGSPAYTGPAWWGWVVAAAIGSPLAVRRLWPVAGLAVVVAGAVAAALCDIAREPFLPVALALYAVGALESRRRSWQALAVAQSALLGAVVLGSAVVTSSETPAGAGVLAVAVGLVTGSGFALGRAVRAHRRVRAVVADADRRRAVADERLRIARDLHDVVSHSLTVIAVQAAVAQHVADRADPAAATLQSIEDTARSALGEMRGVLGDLHGSGPVGADGSGLDGSGPGEAGMAALTALVERTRRAAVAVDLTVELPAPLPGPVDRTVYRIVQEGLTNVVRHAAVDRCRVRIAADRSWVRIEVSDDGPAVPAGGVTAGGPGFGLVGLGQRVRAHGGRFAAGPGPGGGFVLRADLPYLAGDPR